MLQTLMGTALSGVGSVLIAALLTRTLLGRWGRPLLSLAAGALLATAFLHLLPEAFEADVEAHDLFLTLLGGLVFFFLLDKAELWHHGHEHHHGGDAQAAEPMDHAHHHHNHAHAHDHSAEHAPGSWSVLFGDSIHAFGDGVLVAAAFLVDPALGWAASFAVLAHEIPHHIGDLVVLSNNRPMSVQAVGRLCLAGSVTVLGGFLGHSFLHGQEAWLPYLLVLASSSYIYVALADLIPQLQQRNTALGTLMQVGFLAIGIAMVGFTANLLHAAH